MKDHIRHLVGQAPPSVDPRGVVREYLQARILGALQRAGGMVPLAFHGGTALRFLYGIPRFSEDLDFALELPQAGYDLGAIGRSIRSELSAEGYAVDLRVQESKTVQSAWVQCPGLLHELDLSPHREETLRVKIEVDTSPPSGAGLETTVVRRHLTLRLHHHDRASLLAGKLHAVLQRSWTKGRDIYDLLWYLSDPQWPEPNLGLLDNALTQSGWDGEPITQESWRRVLGERLRSLKWDRVVTDVRPFLERAAEVDLLTLDNLLRVL